jgi:hypothetical protein
MHEQVQQRAGRDQQPRQRAEYVRSALGQQKEAADDEEAEADDPGRRSPPLTVVGAAAAWLS